MSKDKGVVYTKPWVVNFVLDVAGYTDNIDLTLGTAVEPACGIGAFLVQMVRRLCKSARSRGKLNESSLVSAIRAYDLNDDSVTQSKSAVVRVLESEGFAAAAACRLANAWISQEDFLLSEAPQATWVVGNPPYVRSGALKRDVRRRYCDALSCVTMGTDLYVGFIQRGLQLLVQGGKLCYICPDRWLQNQYGRRLRKYVSMHHSLSTHIRLHGVDAFEDDVSAYPAITLIENRAVDQLRYVSCRPSFRKEDASDVVSWLHSGTARIVQSRFIGSIGSARIGEAPLLLESGADVHPIGLAMQKLPSLQEAGVRVGIGLATGKDDVFITTIKGVVEEERLLPLFYMRDWRQGHKERERWLVNPWKVDGTLVDLKDWPLLERYYRGNEDTLKRRYVARMHPNDWYRTLDKPKFELLGRPLLLMPDMATKANPVLTDGSKYPHHNCYWLTSEEWDLRALGGLLMSDVIQRYVASIGVQMRGGTLRFQAQYLRQIHLPLAYEVSSAVVDDLVKAFETHDVQLANEAACRVYGLEA